MGHDHHLHLADGQKIRQRANDRRRCVAVLHRCEGPHQASGLGERRQHIVAGLAALPIVRGSSGRARRCEQSLGVELLAQAVDAGQQDPLAGEAHVGDREGEPGEVQALPGRVEPPATTICMPSAGPAGARSSPPPSPSARRRRTRRRSSRAARSTPSAGVQVDELADQLHARQGGSAQRRRATRRPGRAPRARSRVCRQGRPGAAEEGVDTRSSIGASIDVDAAQRTHARLLRSAANRNKGARARSRKRRHGGAPAAQAPPQRRRSRKGRSRARRARAPRAQKPRAGSVLTDRLAVGERPQAPWHPLPLLGADSGAIGTVVGLTRGRLDDRGAGCRADRHRGGDPAR